MDYTQYCCKLCDKAQQGNTYYQGNTKNLLEKSDTNQPVEIFQWLIITPDDVLNAVKILMTPKVLKYTV